MQLYNDNTLSDDKNSKIKLKLRCDKKIAVGGTQKI